MEEAALIEVSGVRKLCASAFRTVVRSSSPRRITSTCARSSAPRARSRTSRIMLATVFRTSSGRLRAVQLQNVRGVIGAERNDRDLARRGGDTALESMRRARHAQYRALKMKQFNHFSALRPRPPPPACSRKAAPGPADSDAPSLRAAQSPPALSAVRAPQAGCR